MQTLIFVFATCFDNLKDNEKLTELQTLGYDVFSVNRVFSEHPFHINMDFTCVRGFRNLKFLQVIENGKSKKQQLIVCLDFAWLAKGYYTNAYGKKWFSEKADKLIELGIKKIYLPNNKELQIMYDTEYKPNPFFTATLCADDFQCPIFDCFDKVTKTDQKWSQSQLEYTKANKRFMCITCKHE